MEPIDYLRIFRRRWGLIAACVIVAALAAFVTTPKHASSGRPVTSYNASATLLIAPGSTLTPNYVALFVTGGDVPSQAAKQLNYHGNPALLASQVVVDPSTSVARSPSRPRTPAVGGSQRRQRVRGTDDQLLPWAEQPGQQQAIRNDQRQVDSLATKAHNLDAQVAANPGNALLKAQHAAVLQEYGVAYQALQAAITQNSKAADLSILQKATPIPVISSGFVAPTSHKSRVSIGLLLGLALGYGLALFLSRLDTKIRDRAALQRFLRVPVLAEVPAISRGLRGRHEWIVPNDPGSPVAEAYRSLRASLQLIPSSTGVQPGRFRPRGAPQLRDGGPATGAPPAGDVRAVCRGQDDHGSQPGGLLRRDRPSVLVLDCDFRHPDIHTSLGLPQSPGLSDLAFAGDQHQLGDYVRPTGVEGVRGGDRGSAVSTGLFWRAGCPPSSPRRGSWQTSCSSTAPPSCLPTKRWTCCHRSTRCSSSPGRRPSIDGREARRAARAGRRARRRGCVGWASDAVAPVHPDARPQPATAADATAALRLCSPPCRRELRPSRGMLLKARIGSHENALAPTQDRDSPRLGLRRRPGLRRPVRRGRRRGGRDDGACRGCGRRSDCGPARRRERCRGCCGLRFCPGCRDRQPAFRY